MKHIAIFGVMALAIVGLLFSVSGSKAPRIPDNADHLIFNDNRACLPCHGPEGTAPRLETHPPKDQCLTCHNVKDNRRRSTE